MLSDISLTIEDGGNNAITLQCRVDKDEKYITKFCVDVHVDERHLHHTFTDADLTSNLPRFFTVVKQSQLPVFVPHVKVPDVQLVTMQDVITLILREHNVDELRSFCIDHPTINNSPSLDQRFILSFEIQLAAFVCMWWLMEEIAKGESLGELPFTVPVPWRITDGNVFCRHTCNCFQVSLPVIIRVSAGVCKTLLEYANMFTSFWEPYLIDGPTVNITKISTELWLSYSEYMNEKCAVLESRYSELSSMVSRSMSDLSQMSERIASERSKLDEYSSAANSRASGIVSEIVDASSQSSDDEVDDDVEYLAAIKKKNGVKKSKKETLSELRSELLDNDNSGDDSSDDLATTITDALEPELVRRKLKKERHAAKKLAKRRRDEMKKETMKDKTKIAEKQEDSIFIYRNSILEPIDSTDPLSLEGKIKDTGNNKKEGYTHVKREHISVRSPMVARDLSPIGSPTADGMSFNTIARSTGSRIVPHRISGNYRTSVDTTANVYQRNAGMFDFPGGKSLDEV